jgi:hypothetical protein
MSTENTYLILYLFFAISLFLILREFFCWYWKINAMKTLMEEQRDLLKQILDGKKIKTKDTEVANEIKNTDVRVKERSTGKIKTIKDSEWKKIVKNGEQSMYEVMYD